MEDSRLPWLIETALARPDDGCRVVVVTHRVAHPLCGLVAHRGSWDAGSSASDLLHLIDSDRTALWVHGHLHHLVDLARPESTHILCSLDGPGFGNADVRDGLMAKVHWRHWQRQGGRVHKFIPGVVHGSLYVSDPGAVDHAGPCGGKASAGPYV